ncbi:MAG TPA: glycosyltransferase family 4 protein [Candidatus Paceibacterota bacterium]|nr:glycosyltransferase family 4 protein [Candidatus Paceibacterota bacterium]
MGYDVCIAAGTYDKLGGIERYSVELAQALVAAGHRVSIVASSVGYPTDNLERVIPIRTDWRVPALTHLAKAAKASRIYRAFKREHPDGLFISNGLYSFNTDFMIAQSVHRQAVIVTNAREPKTAKGYLRRIARKLRPINLAIILVEGWAVRRGARRVIAIANKVKREIVALYGVSDERVVVVHSGVNAHEFAPNPAVRARIRSEMKFADGDFVFLFSGNEFKRKGLNFAIEALAELGAPHAKLVVAGKADNRAFRRLADERGVGDRVFFIGPRSDFADWCAAADAFLFPTLDEPFGLVIAEALAAGLPTITSGPRYAGASERMKDGYDSLLLDDPTDVHAMARAMRRLVDDPKLCAELAKHGRATAEGLSWERVAREITEAWTSYNNHGIAAH